MLVLSTFKTDETQVYFKFCPNSPCAISTKEIFCIGLRNEIAVLQAS
jgi:hypothetical protein